MTSQEQNSPPEEWATLERHALVMSVWLSAGFVAFVLLVHGYSATNDWLVGGGFAVVLMAFVGHVIINALYNTVFTAKEVALGLVVYGLGLIWFLLSLLFGNEITAGVFLPSVAGFLTLLLVVAFYMVTHFGVRGAFDAFDVIREFRP